MPAALSKRASRTARASVARTVVLILGMHRSGTSALARVTSLLGAGLPDNMMPPVLDNNETGFWESRDIADFNDELLASAGSRWDDWRPFNPHWRRSALAPVYAERAGALIEQVFAAQPLIVLKDPRLCRLLPFWLAVFARLGATVKPILPVRNPLEVAASLRRRDGFAPPKGHLLWLRHVLDAEAATRALPRVFVAYDALLSDWRTVMRALETRLELAWPRWSATSEHEIDVFLRDELKHHRHAPGAIAEHPELSVWVKRAAAACDALLAVPDDPAAVYAELDTLMIEFDRGCVAFGAVLAAEEDARTQAEQARQEAEQARQEAEQARQEVEENLVRLQARQAQAEQEQTIYPVAASGLHKRLRCSCADCIGERSTSVQRAFSARLMDRMISAPTMNAIRERRNKTTNVGSWATTILRAVGAT